MRLECTCGKGFQVLNSRPGKRFQCTQCGSVVTVPGQKVEVLASVADFEVDPFDELVDSDFEEEYAAPVARKARRKRKTLASSKSAKYWRQVGKNTPRALLQVAGWIVGYFGLILGWLYVGLAFVRFCIAMDLITAAILWVLGGLTILGGRASLGRGMQISRTSSWTGSGSVIAGFVMVGVGLAGGIAVVVFLSMVMLMDATRAMNRQLPRQLEIHSQERRRAVEQIQQSIRQSIRPPVQPINPGQKPPGF